MTRKLAFIVAAIGLLAAPGVCLAQAKDTTGRLDLRDGRVGPRESSYHGLKAFALLPQPEQPSFSLSLSWASALNNNIGQDPGSPVAAYYMTPGIEALAKAPLGGGWTLSGDLLVDGDYLPFGRNDLYGESRLDGDVNLAHDVAGGTADLQYRLFGSFTPGFGSRNYYFQRYRADYGGSLGPEAFKVAFNYDTSPTPELRRVRLDATLKTPLGTTWGALKWDVVTTAQFSDFRAGANDGRRDLAVQTTLEANRDLNKTLSAGLALSYSHRFSNMASKRFDAVEIGPNLSIALP